MAHRRNKGFRDFYDFRANSRDEVIHRKAISYSRFAGERRCVDKRTSAGHWFVEMRRVGEVAFEMMRLIFGLRQKGASDVFQGGYLRDLYRVGVSRGTPSAVFVSSGGGCVVSVV